MINDFIWPSGQAQNLPKVPKCNYCGSEGKMNDLCFFPLEEESPLKATCVQNSESHQLKHPRRAILEYFGCVRVKDSSQTTAAHCVFFSFVESQCKPCSRAFQGFVCSSTTPERSRCFLPTQSSGTVKSSITVLHNGSTHILWEEKNDHNTRLKQWFK